MIILWSVLTLIARADDGSWVVPSSEAPEPICVQLMSVSPNHRRLDDLNQRATAQIAAIKSAAESVREGSRSNWRTIARAAEAAVTKHHHEYAEEPDLRKLDYQRHLAILKEIEEFDAKRPAWSLFKIGRVIETRHSVAKYADCVED